jgi:hypothetical protein
MTLLDQNAMKTCLVLRYAGWTGRIFSNVRIGIVDEI